MTTVNLSVRSRLLSFFELSMGIFIVLGHNVWRILPNEVPILFVIGWISLRWRDGGWKAAGLVRPVSWTRTILAGLAAAGLLQLGSELVVSPLTARLWPPQHVSQLFQPERLDWQHAATLLLIIWTFAAFGEELSYRGYLLTRAADLGKQSVLSRWLGMFLVAVLFGFGHYYKGPAGVIDSTYSGLVLGAVYLLSGRNLWPAILAHGMSDTFAVIAVFLGWAN